MKLSCLVSAALIFLFHFSICGQKSYDSTMYKESVARIQQIYLSEINDNAEIFHGNEYIRNGQKANGFPFFESDKVFTGTIWYQGIMYSNQSLYYDMVSDEVIIPTYAKNALIALSPDKADSFSIETRLFVRLKSKGSNHLVRDGYYEQLFKGEPGVYAGREKKLVTGSGSEESKYVQYNSYFIRLNDVFYAVDGKSSVLDIFKDKEDVIRKYIHTNKLDFKKNFESALILSVIYYSQLKH